MSECGICGPGYRYGDDGCRHTPPPRSAATIAAEITSALNAGIKEGRGTSLFRLGWSFGYSDAASDVSEALAAITADCEKAEKPKPVEKETA